MRLVDESFTLRRVARRLGAAQPPRTREEPPELPIGVKLELTYHCNLRCGFCYTDSPRHTAERTPDMGEDEWLRIVDECLALGAVEAVVTGGEPLLRPQMTLAVIDRLAAGGVGVTLNSNGWFVDEAMAARLGEVPGLHVHVSLDGARPDIHDASRGVPGSWRRAVAGMHHMLENGIAVHGVHVVTPENEAGVGDYLEQMWALGLPAVRVTPVVPVGAAARGGKWGVSRARIESAISRFRERHGNDMSVLLSSGTGAAIVTRDDLAPAALLVRPDGRVRIDSMHPFTFGHALEDGLAECWGRIREGWRDPEIDRWAAGISSTTGLSDAGLVPYLDEEAELGAPVPARRTSEQRQRTSEQKVLEPVVSERPADTAAADREARDQVRALALSRRYRHAGVRATQGAGGRVVRRLADGGMVRLNDTGATAFDALAAGTPADAVAKLRDQHPAISRARLEDDVLAVARRLTATGVILPAEARGPMQDVAASVPDLPGEAVGRRG